MRDGMILGQGRRYSTDSATTGLNNNVLVCGGSGSGKTWSIAEPRLLETYDSSVIVTATKRRIVDMYKPLFVQRGYSVIDLDFISPQKCSHAYDPLLQVRTCEDISFLARSIVLARSKGCALPDPYWIESATALFSAEIALVLAEADRERPLFPDVLRVHDSLEIHEGREGTIHTSLDARFSHLWEDGGLSSFALSSWRSFKNLPIRTAGCVFGELHTAVDSVFSPGVRLSMENLRKTDFLDLAKTKTALFITTSPVNSSFQVLINLLYAQAFKDLFEYAESLPGGALPTPVHVIADDFATGGQVQDFPELISIFREKGISCTLLLQSESQLSHMYGEAAATTIINNCDTYVFMGGMDLETARHISLRANIPLEDALCLPIGQEIIFRRGERPVFTQRYDIRRDERYQALAETYENQRRAKFIKEALL